MADRFHEIVFTDSVRKAQAHYYGKSQRIERAPERDALTEDETAFIQSRDSFYMATVSETGWPYVHIAVASRGFCGSPVRPRLASLTTKATANCFPPATSP